MSSPANEHKKRHFESSQTETQIGLRRVLSKENRRLSRKAVEHFGRLLHVALGVETDRALVKGTGQ